MDIREVLNRPEYDFIKTNPHLGGSMIFATFGGSHAYGTNTPDSDIDIRGCAFNSRTDILGRTNFEQVIDNPTDTTIYSFNKLIHLLSDCNPNTIELLGCKPEQYVFFNDIGRMMVEQRDMFLSQKAVHAFGGYATQQLRRLQAALARDRYDQSEKEKQILSSCKSSMTSFNDRYQEFENGAIHLYVDESQREDLDTEIFLDVNLTHYPLRDYKNIWSDLNTIVKEYGKITQRNKKKDEAHLNKHALHLIRLYLMCLDILEKQEINTYRGADLPLLMSIRNGEYMPFVQEELFFQEVGNLKLIQNGKNLSVEKVVNKFDKDRFSAVAYLLYYIVKVGEGDNQKSDFDAKSFAKKLQALNRKPRMY